MAEDMNTATQPEIQVEAGRVRARRRHAEIRNAENGNPRRLSRIRREGRRPGQGALRENEVRRRGSDLVLEDTYATASKGCSDYGLKLIENTRANTDAAFDLIGGCWSRSPMPRWSSSPPAICASSSTTVTAQAKDLASTRKRSAADTAEPMKEGLTTAFKKAA